MLANANANVKVNASELQTDSSETSSVERQGYGGVPALSSSRAPRRVAMSRKCSRRGK